MFTAFRRTAVAITVALTGLTIGPCARATSAPVACKCPGAGSSAAATACGSAARDGARIASETWLDDRMVDLEISSSAVGATVPVRLLLPAGWARDTTRTWPVLYLLQGAHDDYTSWTRETDIESFTSDKGVIVVMPSAGPVGISTSWFHGGKGGPDYEKFQTVELEQLLQRDYRANSVRAVAGVSTGGYSAVMMAAHYPGTFAAAASYSGILDTTAFGIPALMYGIVARENFSPPSLWGDPSKNASLWAADNPYDQAEKLRQTALFISSGSGQESKGEELGNYLEQALWSQANLFVDRVRALGIPAQTDLYPGGVHDWPRWQIEFKRSWPLFVNALGLSQSSGQIHDTGTASSGVASRPDTSQQTEACVASQVGGQQDDTPKVHRS